MTTAELAEYKERVRAGVAFLDEHVEGWRDRLDLDQLNMSGCSKCVLGQLYGWYYDGCRALSLGTASRRALLGFEELHDEGENYLTLTNAWLEELRS